MKLCVYSCVTNNYDTIASPPKWDGVDFVLFTDNEDYNGNGWEVKVIKDMYYKYIKMHPHVLLPDYTHYIWIDASMTIISSYKSFVSILEKHDFALFKHPNRSCVYDEIAKCIELKKDTEEKLLAQKSYIKSLGIKPKSKLLYQSGTLFIKKTDKVIEFLELWYNQTFSHSRRDQVSLIPTIHLIGWQPYQIPYYYFRGMIKLSKHKPKSNLITDFKIYEFIPYSHEKNFSKAINQYCSIVPNDNDWIIIRDGDTSHTTSHWQSIIREVILKHGNEYALFGAKTNRIGSTHQRVKGMFNIYDMREHWKKGQELFETHQYNVEENKNGVAGFFMMFQKKTWNKIKFDESKDRCKYFDTYFFQDIKRAKFKSADILGLYVFHFYRIWEHSERSARSSRKHLY